MLIIGLTGSIATGKSSVSAVLSKPPYNLPIIDADLLAREVVEPGTSGYRQIVAHFGPDILLPIPASESEPQSQSQSQSQSKSQPESGSINKAKRSTSPPIDRAALGRLVFGSSDSAQAHRQVLNRIIHPAVRRRMAFLVLRAYTAGHWAVVLDVPLLFESGLDIFCGAVLLVGISEADVQLARLLARDREMGGCLSEEEARGRVASQGAISWKVRRVEARRSGLGVGAAEVLWNDGLREDLERGVAGVLGRWRRASPRWWCALLWALPPVALAVAAWWFARAWLVRRRCLREEQLEAKGE